MKTELKEESTLGSFATIQEKKMGAGPGAVKADGPELHMLPKRHHI